MRDKTSNQVLLPLSYVPQGPRALNCYFPSPILRTNFPLPYVQNKGTHIAGMPILGAAEWRDTPYNPVRETLILQNCFSLVRLAVREKKAGPVACALVCFLLHRVCDLYI